jgi:hypothetical protein
MRYEAVQTLKDEDFKQSTGVQRSTFEKMLEVVETGLRDFSRTPKLRRADQLLMTLMYWCEYRTEFHIGLTYGVSEATVCRTIQKVENVLIQSKQFHLPGKKVLQPSDTVIESEHYRKRSKRFGLRFHLIAAICNIELKTKS